MSRLVSSCLAAFWVTIFVRRASDLLPLAAQGKASAVLSLFVFMLAAMLFLRLFLTVWNKDVARTAGALDAAVAVAMVTACLDVLSQGGHAHGMEATCMQVAALGVTCMVVRMEAGESASPADGAQWHRRMARHLARAAGFQASMTHLSRHETARTES